MSCVFVSKEHRRTWHEQCIPFITTDTSITSHTAIPVIIVNTVEKQHKHSFRGDDGNSRGDGDGDGSLYYPFVTGNVLVH